MDPFSAATTFATIVSLMADFLSARNDRASQTYDEFMAWLQEERHNEIKALLESNRKTVISIKAILNEDRKVLADQFNRLDLSLATVAGAIDGFSSLADAIRPDAKLSPQALNILRQFDASGATEVLYFTYVSAPPGLVTDRSVNINYDEPRFLKDDLDNLVGLGLLREKPGHKGEDRIYVWTRAASDIVRSTHGLAGGGG